MPRFSIKVADGRTVDLDSPDQLTATSDANARAKANPPAAATPQQGEPASPAGPVSTFAAPKPGPVTQSSLPPAAPNPLADRVDARVNELTQQRMSYNDAINQAENEERSQYGPGKGYPTPMEALVLGKGYTGPTLSKDAQAAYLSERQYMDSHRNPIDDNIDHAINGFTFGQAPAIVGFTKAMRAKLGLDPGNISWDDAFAGGKQAEIDELGRQARAKPIVSGAGELVGSLKAPGMGMLGKFVGAPSVAATAVKGSGLGAKAGRGMLGGLETTVKSGAVGA